MLTVNSLEMALVHVLCLLKESGKVEDKYGKLKGWGSSPDDNIAGVHSLI